MHTLTIRQGRDLARLLRQGEQEVREHAADLAYRRDAMKAIRDRTLAAYLDQRWSSTLGLAEALAAAAQHLVPLHAAEPCHACGATTTERDALPHAV